MFSVRSLFSEIYRDGQCSMNSPLSDEKTNRFHTAKNKILLTRTLSFPSKIIFNYASQLYIFFDGSLHGYGACVYIHSHRQFNLISSSCKVLGKSTFSAPKSEITSPVLATRMQQKISQELYNISLSSPVFIGDSQIILRMIAQ